MAGSRQILANEFPRAFFAISAVRTVMLYGALLILPISSTPTFAETTDPCAILILCSYHVGHVWTDDELGAQRDEFLSSIPEIEIHVEFLDWKRFPSNDILKQKSRYLADKYRGVRLRLVLANDNVALETATQLRETVFPGVPIVFAGINGYDEIAPVLPPNVTGVVEEIDPFATLSLALSVHPKTRTVLIITDLTESGRGTRGEVERAIQKLNRNDISFEFTDTLTMHALLHRLRELNPKTLVFMTYFNWDSTGRFYGHEESVALVASASTVPVYHSYDFALGRGILGGRLLSGRAHGQAAARLALRILRGEPIDSVPVLLTSPCSAIFDAAVMRKFGIKRSDLPPDAILVNVVETPWSRYRAQIIAAIIFMLVQGIIVTILLFSIIARKRAEVKLRESE